jgi:hypothetical protein
METESGKKASNRPQLQAALDLCRKSKATLLIAKLDRLARNVHFISGLLESGVNFVAADAPSKDRFMLHVQAAFAEEEARRISLRTREALAAAKRRGVEVGAAGKVLAMRHARKAFEKAQTFRTVFEEVREAGARTTKDFRDYLNARGIAGPGGGRWHLPITHRTLKRLGMMPGRKSGAQVVQRITHCILEMGKVGTFPLLTPSYPPNLYNHLTDTNV